MVFLTQFKHKQMPYPGTSKSIWGNVHCPFSTAIYRK